MLNAILDFFDRHIGPTSGSDGDDRSRHSIELATAALLVETVRVDSEMTAPERDAVLRAVESKFGLSGEEARQLIALAEEELRHANDYFQFTSLINRHFTQAQKIRVIELMWEVAYADARISAHERHLLRKIADLLHVTHPDYIAAQERSRRAPGGA